MLDDDPRARACADVMWNGDRASQQLGMLIEYVAAGRSRLSMTVREDMVNGWGICHGALVTAVADSAFAFACNTYDEVRRHGDLASLEELQVSLEELQLLSDGYFDDGEQVAATVRQAEDSGFEFYE